MRIKNKKKFIIAISIIVIILLLIVTIVATRNKNKKYNSIEDFKNVKEVLEYLGCDYIRTKNIKDDKYKQETSVKFNRNLYENGKSNERFFNNLVQMVTKVNKYKSIILTDKERKITIKIDCNDANTELNTWYVNDIENYFAKQDSNNTMTNVKEEETIKLTINSNILEKAIKNKWITGDIKFGSKESEFEGYNIYADEGIRTKIVGNKVFNIVFEKEYDDSIVNNIKVGTSLDEVRDILGEPTYENNTIEMIGYKNEDIYIFFNKDQVSVYRNDESYDEKFYKLVESFANNEIDFQACVNELTTLWIDYAEYINTEEYYELTYPLKGITVQVSSENKDGIHIYSNYVGLQKNENIEQLIETGKVHIHADKNLVFETEFKRVAEERNLLYACQDYIDKMETGKPQSNLFYYSVDRDSNEQIKKVKFVSIDGSNINSELKENINSYIWFSDTIFLYGKAKDGIYAYDAVKRESRKLLSGTDNFEIKGIEDGRLKYDDKSVQIGE